MIRERALRVVLVLVGLLFLAGVYPLMMSLWQQKQQDTEPMMLSVYVTLGIFLVLAARNRSEEHTSELQSRGHVVCRLLLEKYNIQFSNVLNPDEAVASFVSGCMDKV